MSGASDFAELSRDLGRVPAQSIPAIRPYIQDGAARVKAAWQANARETSGAHGRHYPNSITYDTRVLASEVVGEIGPDSAKPQGSMGRGFEFGSKNQPPHLDGLRAVDSVEASIERDIDVAIARLIP